MKKYDDLAMELQQIEYLPFIESTTDDEDNAAIDLKTIFANKDIHFTTDGKEVTQSDPIFDTPFALERPCVVKAACFNELGEAIRTERYFRYHLAMGRLKKLNSPAGNYRPEYSGGGDNALVDGSLGGDSYMDGHWQGLYGIDADLEIDFGKDATANSIEIGFLVNAHDWILRPDKVVVYTSMDGVSYQPYKTFPVTTEVKREGNFVFREKFETPNLSTRYLRIVVKNPGKLPEGLPGAGYDSWIFMDEIVVE